MDTWVIVVLVIAGSYLIVCIGAWVLQDYFLFHPEKLSRNFRFRYDMPFEEIILQGADWSIISALHFPVEGADEVVFYFKGNTRSIKGWAKFARDFTSKGYNFFMIDYPGFGKSTGKRTEHLINVNVQMAYNWLKEKYPEKKIIIYGRSLGAGFAAKCASKNKPKVLILDSPFYTFRSLAKYYTQILPLRWLLRFKMPLYRYVRHLSCPTFILHGDKDWMIPYRFSLMIVNIAPERIKLFTIKGARHNNLPKFEAYHESLLQALRGEIRFPFAKPQPGG